MNIYFLFLRQEERKEKQILKVLIPLKGNQKKKVKEHNSGKEENERGQGVKLL